MNSRILVVDTNVVVAGLLTSDAGSAAARMLDGMLAARFSFALAETLLDEYRAVLRRPALRRLHGLSDIEIDCILTDLAQNAIFLRATVEAGAAISRAPDSGDQFLWDLLASEPRCVLVTGDKRLLLAPDMAGRIISPRAVIDDEDEATKDRS